MNVRNRDNILINTAVKLIKREAIPNLRNMLAKTHTADIALIIKNLRPDEKPVVFQLLKDEVRAGEVLKELDIEDKKLFIENVPEERLEKVLQAMSADDVTNLLEKLPEEETDRILQLLKKGKASEDVENLLKYDEKTAGHIMDQNFFALPQEITASEAIKTIQNLNEVEMIFYVYVIDDKQRLVGVISLRQLVTTKPDTPLKDLMKTRVYSVHTNTDQEEVAEIVARYNLLAVPVLDEDDKLVGIVTVDDVIDIIHQEATEDILKISGTSGISITSNSIWENVKARVPWLFATLISGILASQLIGLLGMGIKNLVLITAFLPIVMAMGGNVGTQSSAMISRGLATGEISLKTGWRIFARQFVIGIFLGAVYGICLSIFTGVRYWQYKMPLVVSLSICANMSIAATTGTAIPMLFERFKIDPAIASGPFVTTSSDILGILIYFTIARIII